MFRPRLPPPPVLKSSITNTNTNGKMNCKYKERGCKYLLDPEGLKLHHLECRFRDFACEGQYLGCWTCDWTGRYNQIQKHFQEAHEDSTLMLFKTEAILHLDLTEEYNEINLIDYREGQNFFYFKCRVDLETSTFYAAVQLIGTREVAKRYCYEFEICKGPVRKIKVTEICESDCIDVDDIFADQNCVAISFDTLKNYLDENNDLRFRFRIMSIKNNQGF